MEGEGVEGKLAVAAVLDILVLVLAWDM